MAKCWCRIAMVGAAAAGLTLFTACGPKSAKSSGIDALQAYVSEAKTQPAPAATAEGSLWVPNSRRSELFRDFRARNVNDVVTIRVVESTLASASADATNSRATEAKAGFESLAGLQGKVKELPSLVAGKSS